MSQRNDGGPAFPRHAVPHDYGVVDGHPGMSLRDHFATAAMMAHGPLQPGEHLPTLARDNYRFADYMLAVREQKDDEVLTMLRTLRDELRAFGPRPEVDAADELLHCLEFGDAS